LFVLSAKKVLNVAVDAGGRFQLRWGRSLSKLAIRTLLPRAIVFLLPAHVGVSRARHASRANFLPPARFGYSTTATSRTGISGG
jgi:hypothetical protein